MVFRASFLCHFDCSFLTHLPLIADSYTPGDELLVEATLGPLTELRCLTFNVLHDPEFGPEEQELAAAKGADGDSASEDISRDISAPRVDPTLPSLRTPACFKFLASRRAHIITLNEVSPQFFSELLKEPWLQSYWISELDISKYHIGNCILSAYPIRTSYVHKFRMSEKVNNIAEVMLPGADRPPLWVSTAHLKAGPAQSNGRFRRSQSNEMTRQLEYVSSKGSNSIIQGDLNIRSTEGEVLEALADWTDSWVALRPDDVGYTYDPWNNTLAKMASERVCGLDSRRVKMANRYDRILSKGRLEASSVEILATEPFGTFPDSQEPLHISDHFALETVFKFTSQP